VVASGDASGIPSWQYWSSLILLLIQEILDFRDLQKMGCRWISI
jgi:hypothetical protein